MAVIQPVRALRYGAKAGDIAGLATLPYDVIPPALEAEYKARSPYNFAHLILPNGDYAGAAAKLDSWLRDGILAQDSEPAYWLYEQVFPAPGSGEILTRRGFVGLGATEEYGRNVFRHERTMSGPKEDRYQLLRHTRVQFDSIFMLYSDDEGAIEASLAARAEAPPDMEYTDHERTLHRLWRVADPGVLAAVTAGMSGRPLLIADGHHRYETALRMGQPWTLMTFVRLQSPGLKSFATHRLLHSMEGFDAERFLQRLPNLAEGLELRSPAGFVRIGVATRAGLHHCDIPAAPGALNVAVLQDEVLTPLLGLTPEKVAAGGHLRYVKKLEEALAEVESGQAQAAFLLDDLPVDGVARVSFAGQVLPQKSTFFYPKLGSGAVMYRLEE